MSAPGSKPETILVATDFSETSARAVDVALAFARFRGAKLCLLHVFEPPSITVPELGLNPAAEHDLRERGTRRLAAAAADLRTGGVVAVEELLAIGSPAAEIIAEVAARTEPALVVIGSHGRRPLPRLLMGSVAERALLNIKQPVMVVPSSSAVAGSPPAQGARWRVAVGIDLSNSAAAAVEWVRDLRSRADCDVVFIHLYWPAAEYARFGLPGPRDLFQEDQETIQLLKKALEPAIGTLPGHGEITLRVLPSWGAPGERLVVEAREAKADLLVLGTHHRHGVSRLLHGSTVPPALHVAALPIVCISGRARPPAQQPIPHLRSVLAATDLSEFSNRAIAHAYALARGERAVVHLLHVHERASPQPAYAYAPQPEDALTQAEAGALRARLQAQIPAQAAALGITTEVMVVEGGSAAEVICQTAERLGADAISLGSHGRGGLGRLALGSVTGRVLHSANRPVFVVRGQPD